MTLRKATVKRETLETTIQCTLKLDGSGKAKVDTGIGFLDHLLSSLAKHARFDLTLSCKGDLHIDDHHTAEDCALVLGEAFDRSLGERKGISRYGYAYAPLDEALARTVVDLVTRPYAVLDLDLQREYIGTLATENVEHILYSFAMAARLTLHVDVLKGANDHHRAEAAFKSLALALRQAVTVDRTAGDGSTKGSL